ncbi:uncharacterized protein L3040_009296 [Drepanopeziza brunnea f. sp. 'multigermtubi']|uniref:Centromere protein Cenp-K n=1 Tax=Marssonina brunnea f. sp. multigermtubi (strain MB_m1) TaxID=1072389 RepID=K1Y295_MARBU|nr:uncharacterized protein MBM_02501 [Drepanopeziza brunnea f. sp. 'multigermtubi' MB_m1]EKD19264.1 hypothetical protein MBM_02501 [Drepanopeziza brunnea f. sp. 'multigermtubi' MB_m1]KAJ5032702.1 hypothetical protein L3040_009296 [Drepanopeziza brunnea f. sp. 'multigermtubi']
MDSQQSSESPNSHTMRLDKTLKSLQARVREQEALLEELRASTTPLEVEPSSDRKTLLQQLRALKAAYESLTPSQPWLPPHTSAIPGLLALRVTDKVIKESEDSLVQTEAKLKTLRRRLEQEYGNLKDAKLIQSEMELRIASLQERIEEREQQSPSQMANEMIQAVKQRKTFYDNETGRLVQAFNRFIDDHLAAMLAVEELGGPIVGEIPEVDDELLEGEFSAHGKPKKGKPSEDKRQRRIDQIWGPRPEEEEEEGETEPRDERRVAAAEMRDLTEQLLNGLVDTEGIGPAAYVDLQRESAAARFLVRSKVAQFHPRDARKLRLIDFGSEIDD